MSGYNFVEKGSKKKKGARRSEENYNSSVKDQVLDNETENLENKNADFHKILEENKTLKIENAALQKEKDDLEKKVKKLEIELCECGSKTYHSTKVEPSEPESSSTMEVDGPDAAEGASDAAWGKNKNSSGGRGDLNTSGTGNESYEDWNDSTDTPGSKDWWDGDTSASRETTTQKTQPDSTERRVRLDRTYGNRDLNTFRTPNQDRRRHEREGDGNARRDLPNQKFHQNSRGYSERRWRNSEYSNSPQTPFNGSKREEDTSRPREHPSHQLNPDASVFYGRRGGRSNRGYRGSDSNFSTGSSYQDRRNERTDEGGDFNSHYSRRSFSHSDTETMKLKYTETDGNLFEAPETCSLAHCVAEDLRMGSGIAVDFLKKFKHREDLMDQRKGVGDVAVLQDNNRYIYYLITKERSTGKPSIEDLKRSLLAMKDHCEENNVKEIAMPRIGCGLDRLNWKDVRVVLKNVFKDLDATITVFNFTPENSAEGTQSSAPRRSSLRVVEGNLNLVSIESDTVLLYFGSADGFVNRTIEDLDKKYDFVRFYRGERKRVGDVIECVKKNELLCGLIVKNTNSDYLSYQSLRECLLKIRPIFKQKKKYYFGFEAFIDGEDKLTVPKVISIINDVFFYVESELWVCWPPHLLSIKSDLIDNEERGTNN